SSTWARRAGRLEQPLYLDQSTASPFGKGNRAVFPLAGLARVDFAPPGNSPGLGRVTGREHLEDQTGGAEQRLAAELCDQDGETEKTCARRSVRNCSATGRDAGNRQAARGTQSTRGPRLQAGCRKHMGGVERGRDRRQAQNRVGGTRRDGGSCKAFRAA